MLATQNPIELEGTYPLPEAQLDRFLFNTVLDYLPAEDEMRVVDLTTTTSSAQAETVTSGEEVRDFQQLVRMTPVAESVARYAVDVVRARGPIRTAKRRISSRNMSTSGPACVQRNFWCSPAKRGR